MEKTYLAMKVKKFKSLRECKFRNYFPPINPSEMKPRVTAESDIGDAIVCHAYSGVSNEVD
jgi:hypothetical protein